MMVDPSSSESRPARARAVFERALWADIYRFARPHRRLLLLSIVLLVLMTPLQLAGPFLVKEIVDGPVAFFAWDERVGAGPAPSAEEAARQWTWFLWLVAAMLGAIVLRGLVKTAQMAAMTFCGQRAMHDMRVAVFSRFQGFALRYFEKRPVGALVTRVTNDVDALNEFFTSGIDVLCYDVIAILVLIGALFWLHPIMAAIALACVPMLLFASLVFRNRARESFRAVRAQVTRLMAFLQESLAGMRVIQIFGQEARKSAEFDVINRDHRAAHVRTMYNFAVFFPLVEFLASISVGAILWYGGREIIQGELSAGGFLTFWLLLQQLFQPIRELSEKYNILQGALAAGERLVDVLHHDEFLEQRPDAQAPPRLQGAIEFRDVRFSYQQGAPVLKGVSFRIEPGQTVAIVGPTGAGKSTIIKLISRLYDVTGGAVLIDGRDVREYQAAPLRRQIGVVLQDVFLFQGTVRENLTLGRLDIDDERLIAAARTVHAHEFLQSLPGGYDAAVQESGATFSFGQRQLLAFARTLAADPAILILDEATAHIDSQTEQLIQDAMARLIQHRTSVIIAHRISTVERADHILVVQDGIVVQAGSHEDLLAQEGLYESLCRVRFQD